MVRCRGMSYLKICEHYARLTNFREIDNISLHKQTLALSINLPWSNIPFPGRLDLTMVEYTLYQYVRPYHGRIYHIPVNSTLSWSNIPYSGILDLTMVEYTIYRYIRPYHGWIYHIYRYIRPYHGRIYHILVYSTLPWSNIPFTGRLDITMVEYTLSFKVRSYSINLHWPW